MNGGSLMRATRKPLTKPISAPDGEAAEDRDRRRDAVAEGELAHHHRGEHHDRADREVDAGGQDHERLRRADDADDRHLLQDQRQREGGEELAAEQHAEERSATAPARSAARRPGCRAGRAGRARSATGRGARRRRPRSRSPTSTFSNSWDGVLASAIGSTPRLPRGPLRGRSARAARVAGRPDQVRGAGQPQHFSRPSAVSIEVDALDRLVGDQRRRRCR